MGVENVAVIGSGLMGRGIAYAAAVGGFRTVVHDVAAPALDRAFAQIRKDLDDGVARGKLTAKSPGFITSRINAMIGDEAFLMLQEGAATAEDIDKALKLGLNHPMGPFEMVDLVGLDTRLAVLEFLHRSLGEKYRPAPLLVQHVKAGRLGKKVGRGVYDYGGS